MLERTISRKIATTRTLVASPRSQRWSNKCAEVVRGSGPVCSSPVVNSSVSRLCATLICGFRSFSEKNAHETTQSNPWSAYLMNDVLHIPDTVDHLWVTGDDCACMRPHLLLKLLAVRFDCKRWEVRVHAELWRIEQKIRRIFWIRSRKEDDFRCEAVVLHSTVEYCPSGKHVSRETGLLPSCSRSTEERDNRPYATPTSAIARPLFHEPEVRPTSLQPDPRDLQECQVPPAELNIKK